MRIFNVSVLGLTLAMTACNQEYDSEVIRDHYPVELIMYVQDESGQNLLDPQVDGNVLDEPFKFVYQGDVYYLNESHANIAPSENEIPIIGLHTYQYQGEYVMGFGYFNGAEDLEERMEIRWEDGDKDKILYCRDVKKGRDGAPEVVSEGIFFNEVRLLEDHPLVIVR